MYLNKIYSLCCFSRNKNKNKNKNKYKKHNNIFILLYFLKFYLFSNKIV